MARAATRAAYLKGEIPVADKHLQDQAERILARLSAPVTVLDRNEDVHPGGIPRAVDQALTDGVICTHDGLMYLAVPKTSMVLRCRADHPGARDVMILAGELVGAMGNASDSHTENSFDVYRRALRGELSGSELEAPACYCEAYTVFYFVIFL